MLTALGTSLVSTWLPDLVVVIYDRITKPPVVVVEIKRGQVPVSGIAIAASDVVTDTPATVAWTDGRGIARLRLQPNVTKVHVQVRIQEPSFERAYANIHEFEELPALVRLDIIDNFSASVVVPDTAPTLGESEPLGFRYDRVERRADRQVRAIVELDFVEGTPRPPFQAATATRVLQLADVLAEVGIDSEVVWSDELPVHLMGSDRRFSPEELQSVLEAYRNEEREGWWHFYFVLGGQHEYGNIASMMFDANRRGAVLFESPGALEPPMPLFNLLHEIGHMLNVPHPWQTYGDTKSVMTYPYRWEDWSFDDPDVFRFDSVARQHILRGPDPYVRPGGSAFLEYGARQAWMVTGDQ